MGVYNPQKKYYVTELSFSSDCFDRGQGMINLHAGACTGLTASIWNCTGMNKTQKRLYCIFENPEVWSWGLQTKPDFPPKYRRSLWLP